VRIEIESKPQSHARESERCRISRKRSLDNRPT
jgi:hypothetical protein